MFFSGCSLRCAFCQNYSISTERFGKRITPEQLSEIFQDLVGQGAHNINLVSGTHFIPAIREALQRWKPSVPVVFNCSGYESVETLQTLEGMVDVYLPDLKYAFAETGKKYSAAENYATVAQKAILEMHRQVGDVQLDTDGIIQRGLIVRHLILPGNVRNSRAVLDWLAENLPETMVSLMAQYVPCGRAEEFPELSRAITAREYQKVLDHLVERGLDGYVQERSSAAKKYIPSFQLEGLEKVLSGEFPEQIKK